MCSRRYQPSKIRSISLELCQMIYFITDALERFEGNSKRKGQPGEIFRQKQGKSFYFRVCHCYCCCFSHSEYWLSPQKNNLRGDQSRLRSAKQETYNKKRKSDSPLPPPPSCSSGENKIKSRDVSTCLGATQVSVRLTPVQDSFGSSTRPMGVASQNSELPCAITTLQTRCLSFLLAMFSRVRLFFPLHGHKPPPTFRDSLKPRLSLQRRRFPFQCYSKRPDVALYAIGPLFPLPAPPSPHCTLKVSEHDGLNPERNFF